MKHPPLLVTATLLACGLTVAEPHGSPYFSVGDLEADPESGTILVGPDLLWKIDHPSTLGSVATFDAASGSLTVLKEMQVTMHVIGIGRKTRERPYRVGFWAATSNGTWELLFDGTPFTQSAQEAVFERTLPAHTTLTLSGRAHNAEQDYWLPARTSTDGSGFVRGFENGDPMPAAIADGPENFLASYVSDPQDTDGITLATVGPHAMLFCFELGAESPNDSTFDLQDLVVLVTFQSL